MKYKKAQEILPDNIIKIIQEYVDGEYLYIPRIKERIKYFLKNGTDFRIDGNNLNLA